MVDVVNVVGSAGAQLFIGTKAADPLTDDYVEIGEIVNWPAYGRNYELVTHNPINNRKTFKLKGSFNDGSVELTVGRVPSDPGQARLIAALDDVSRTQGDYNFKAEVADDAGGSDDTPTTQYFVAGVFSYTTIFDQVNAVTNAAVRLEINGAITEVAAVDVT